jgi:flagellar protein FlaG
MSQPSLNINGLDIQSQIINQANGLNNPSALNKGNNINDTSQTVNKNDNNIQNALSGNGNSQNTANNNSVDNSKTKQQELSNQIQSDINPSPMLSQAILFKWDSSVGAGVVNVVDFKTGKVVAQIPPEQVLKTMSNYQKGSIYNKQM